jgi:hypothetical protein
MPGSSGKNNVFVIEKGILAFWSYGFAVDSFFTGLHQVAGTQG